MNLSKLEENVNSIELKLGNPQLIEYNLKSKEGSKKAAFSEDKKEEKSNSKSENSGKKNKKGGFKKKFSAKEFKDVMKPYGIRNYDYGLDLY